MSIIGKIVGVTYDCRTASAKWEFFGQEIVRVEMKPLPPPAKPHRCDSLDCVSCWNAGQRYADYRKAKRLEDL